MFRNLLVTTAATNSKLTTLSQLKADLGLGDSLDTFYDRVIDLASNEIAVYLGRASDQNNDVSLGRETIQESFYGLRCPYELTLGRFPLASVESVLENGSTISRLITGADGAIAATQTTFTSAGASFNDNYVGKAITIAGAGASAGDLTTTVASVTDENTLEVSLAAGTTVSGASYEIDNYAFPYIVKKSNGSLAKLLGSVLSPFMGENVTVNYISGWILPGDTGRNLPYGIEEACILLCQYKITQLQSSANFADTLKSVDLEGLGKIEFGDDSSSSTGGQNSMPFDVRSILQRYVQPSFA